MVPKTIIDAMDKKLQWVEQLVKDLVKHVDAIAVDTNIGRDDVGRRPRAREAYGIPINRPITANRLAHISDDDAEEEEEILFE